MNLHMKKVIFLLSVISILALNSCSIDNDDPNFYFESLPIESVEMPNEFIFGESHDIVLNYFRPSDCHQFNNFLINTEGNQRTIAILNTVYVNSNCNTLIDNVNNPNGELVSATLSLNVISTDTYVFNFYQGTDSNNVDQFFVVEVPVIQ